MNGIFSYIAIKFSDFANLTVTLKPSVRLLGASAATVAAAVLTTGCGAFSTSESKWSTSIDTPKDSLAGGPVSVNFYNAQKTLDNKSTLRALVHTSLGSKFAASNIGGVDLGVLLSPALLGQIKNDIKNLSDQELISKMTTGITTLILQLQQDPSKLTQISTALNLSSIELLATLDQIRTKLETDTAVRSQVLMMVKEFLALPDFSNIPAQYLTQLCGQIQPLLTLLQLTPAVQATILDLKSQLCR
jgi:hypothetical protein